MAPTDGPGLEKHGLPIGRDGEAVRCGDRRRECDDLGQGGRICRISPRGCAIPHGASPEASLRVGGRVVEMVAGKMGLGIRRGRAGNGNRIQEMESGLGRGDSPPRMNVAQSCRRARRMQRCGSRSLPGRFGGSGPRECRPTRAPCPRHPKTGTRQFPTEPALRTQSQLSSTPPCIAGPQQGGHFVFWGGGPCANGNFRHAIPCSCPQANVADPFAMRCAAILGEALRAMGVPSGIECGSNLPGLAGQHPATHEGGGFRTL